MSSTLIALLYATCLIIGFCGGVFGYFFAKHQEKKIAEKHQGETMFIKC